MLLRQGEKTACSQTWNSTASHDASTDDVLHDASSDSASCLQGMQTTFPIKLFPTSHSSHLTCPISIGTSTNTTFSSLSKKLLSPFFSSLLFKLTSTLIPLKIFQICHVFERCLSDSRSALCRMWCLPVTSKYLKQRHFSVSIMHKLCINMLRNWRPQSSTDSLCANYALNNSIKLQIFTAKCFTLSKLLYN